MRTQPYLAKTPLAKSLAPRRTRQETYEQALVIYERGLIIFAKRHQLAEKRFHELQLALHHADELFARSFQDDTVDHLILRALKRRRTTLQRFVEARDARAKVDKLLSRLERTYDIPLRAENAIGQRIGLPYRYGRYNRRGA